MVVLLPSARCVHSPELMRSQPLEAQTPSSRDRLLHAAKRLFALQGYEQTATSAIAREAGTSESQLMRYFGGKVGLLEALFDTAWTQLDERIERALAEPGGPNEHLVGVLLAIATTLARDPDLATLLLFENRRLRGGEPRVRLAQGFLAFAELARTLVRKAQAARAIDRSLDATAVTSALMGACEALIRDRIVARFTGGRAFAEREIQRTLESMLRGFAPGAARAARTPRPGRVRRLTR
jgi:AcrR family transcriptional regulator